MRKLPIFIALSLFMVNVCLALPNPAAAYCTQMGYTYNLVKTPQGDRGECVFSATEKCDEWQFLAGKCGQSHSYCLRNGYNIRAASDGKNSYAYGYAVCVPKTPGQKERPVTDFIALSENNAPPATSKAVNYAASSKSAQASLPSSFDWRNVNSYNWMTPVKNQGSCGDCWDFAAVGITEAKIKIDSNNPSSNPDLSEQDVLSCNGISNCTGGTTAVALNYMTSVGVVDEACFPYVGIDANGHDVGSGGHTPVLCSSICSNWQSRKTKVSLVGAAGKAELVSIGPITAYISMNGKFDSNGIYKCNATDLKTNHAIMLVGYNDSGSYWIAKNSWGSTWNGDGYFKIYYGNCSIVPDEYVVLPAIIPTGLNQLVTPASGTLNAPATPIFTCNYTSVFNLAVQGASTYVSIDSVRYAATYSSTLYTYVYSGVSLFAGSHTWNCTASKVGYQTQAGPNLIYVVNSPACNSDCTLGSSSVCSASCSGINGCTSFNSLCSNVNKGTLKCTDSYNYVACCNGVVTSCSTTTISCPTTSFCSGADICTYPATISCSNTCSGGSCQKCTPTCVATCKACPNAGTTCNPNYGKCMQTCVKGTTCPT